jgi:hypothetical protein
MSSSDITNYIKRADELETCVLERMANNYVSRDTTCSKKNINSNCYSATDFGLHANVLEEQAKLMEKLFEPYIHSQDVDMGEKCYSEQTKKIKLSK